MASLHANRGRLPDDRADLYNDSVDLLMLRWNRQIGADKALLDELAIPTLKLSDLREVLEELAFKVHAESVVATAGTPRISRARTGGHGRHRRRPPAARLPAAARQGQEQGRVVVDYIEKRAGLLLGQGERHGERQFAFPHRTFQEFLAACHLAARPEFAAEVRRLARERRALAGRAAAGGASRQGRARRERRRRADRRHERSPTSAARETPAAADWSCALLAGMQLLEIGVGAIRQRERTRAIATASPAGSPPRCRCTRRWRRRRAAARARRRRARTQLGDPRRHLLDVDRCASRRCRAALSGWATKDNGDAPLHRNETLDYDYWIAEAPVTSRSSPSSSPPGG
jgi:hypothetical protein